MSDECVGCEHPHNEPTMRMKTTVFADVFMAANGRLQQIAAKGFSIPLDMIAILLQGFVLHLCPSCGETEPHK